MTRLNLLSGCSCRSRAGDHHSGSDRDDDVQQRRRVELSLDERFSGMTRFVELLPRSVPRILAAGEVGLLRADEQVFATMLDGWRAQMLWRAV